jgi:hypothetical protein
MSSYPVEWGTYAISVATADIITRNSNVEIIVESTGGYTAVLNALETDYAPFSVGLSYPELSYATQGLGPYAEEPWVPAKHIRGLVASELLQEGLVTAPATGVNTVPDADGGNIPSLAWIPTMGKHQFAIMEAYGIDVENGINIVDIGMGELAWPEIILGRVAMTIDAVNLALAEPQESAGGKLVFLPIGREQFDMAKAKYPEAFAAMTLEKLPAEALPGINIDRPVDVMVNRNILLGHVDNLSDDSAYEIVTALVENYEDVQAIAYGVSTFAPENACIVQDIVAYHPGAIKAFKELGLWTSDHDAANQRALAVIGEAR